MSLTDDPALRARLDTIDQGPGATISTLEWVADDAPPPPQEKLPVAPMGGQDDDELEIVDLLGKGGMGVVHVARQSSLAREVALKMPHEDAKPHTQQALVDEARTTGMLEHPNIPPVHSLWESQGRPVLVMKRIRGVPWDDLIADPEHEAWRSTKHRDDPPLVRHVKLLEDVCDALHYAHSKGIVHRDLKPENVMVGAFGEVYLLDWGVAIAMDELAAQAEGSIVGTPSYMAPEMTDGRADVRSDVFLCGALLHEVLTGEPRFAGSSLYFVLVNAATCEPYRYASDLPGGLVAICQKATAREPDDRYQTIAELQDALGDWLRHRGAEELAREALRRLEAAEQGDERSGQLLIESHFGFVTALREWPEHPMAQEGLERCQLARVRHALSQGQLELAESLLSEVESPSAQVMSEVAVLRAEAARLEGLHARAQDLDLSFSQRERVVLGVVLAAVGVGLWALSFLFPASEAIGSQDIAYPAIALAALSMVSLAYWKRLSTNLISRQWLITMAATLFAWLMSRTLGYHHHVPMVAVLSFDLVILSLGVGVFSVWTARWIAPGLIFNVIAVGVMALHPEWHTLAFMAAFAGSVGWLGLGYALGWGAEGRTDA